MFYILALIGLAVLALTSSSGGTSARPRHSAIRTLTTPVRPVRSYSPRKAARPARPYRKSRRWS